jgi:hypothetical protein
VGERVLEAIAGHAAQALRDLVLGEIVGLRRIDIGLRRQRLLRPQRLPPAHRFVLEHRTRRLVDVRCGEIVHAEADLLLCSLEEGFEHLPARVRRHVTGNGHRAHHRAEIAVRRWLVRGDRHRFLERFFGGALQLVDQQARQLWHRRCGFVRPGSDSKTLERIGRRHVRENVLNGGRDAVF